MFFEEQINQCLICPCCREVYDEPKSLPCGKIICNRCLLGSLEKSLALFSTKDEADGDVSSQHSPEDITCCACGETHHIPVAGFPTCVAIAQLLNQKPAFRSESVGQLKDLLKELQEAAATLHEETKSGIEVVRKHCENLRSEIETVTTRRLEELARLKDELLAQLDKYENECLTSLSDAPESKDQFKVVIDETLAFIAQWNTNLTKFESKLDESSIAAATQAAQDLRKELKKQSQQLKARTFKGGNMMFTDHEAPLKTDAIGKLELADREEATFQLTIPDFRKFVYKEDIIWGAAACMVRNLRWEIEAECQQNPETEEPILSFHLNCIFLENEPHTTVNACAEYRLLHISDPKKNYIKKDDRYDIYDPKTCATWGYNEFITIRDILNRTNGYYNIATDSITLEVYLKADEPVIE